MNTELPAAAGISSNTCKGCGKFRHERDNATPFLLGLDGVSEPWHAECAAKALAEHASLTERVRVLALKWRERSNDLPWGVARHIALCSDELKAALQPQERALTQPLQRKAVSQ